MTLIVESGKKHHTSAESERLLSIECTQKILNALLLLILQMCQLGRQLIGSTTVDPARSEIGKQDLDYRN